MGKIVRIALPKLASRINGEHAAVVRERAAVVKAANAALEHAIRCGELLSQAKDKLEHGKWLPWLQANCELSERTAQAYMRLAREFPKLANAKAQRVADIPLREALALIAEPSGADDNNPESEAVVESEDPSVELEDPPPQLVHEQVVQAEPETHEKYQQIPVVIEQPPDAEQKVDQVAIRFVDPDEKKHLNNFLSVRKALITFTDLATQHDPIAVLVGVAQHDLEEILKGWKVLLPWGSKQRGWLMRRSKQRRKRQVSARGRTKKNVNKPAAVGSSVFRNNIITTLHGRVGPQARVGSLPFLGKRTKDEAE